MFTHIYENDESQERCVTAVWYRNSSASADLTWQISTAQPATCGLLWCEVAGSEGYGKSGDEFLYSSATQYTSG